MANTDQRGARAAAQRGSDVLLLDVGDGLYETRALTARGREVLTGRTQPSVRVAQPVGPERRFDVEHAQRVLADGFDRSRFDVSLLSRAAPS